MLTIDRTLRKFFVCVVLAHVARVGIAQSTFGSFVGTVKDPSGSVVVGCAIVVKNLGTSASRTVITDVTGSYTVVNLEPGIYELTMEMRGFQRAAYSNLPLLARQTVRLDGTLAIGTQTQTVEVTTAREAPINTEVSEHRRNQTGAGADRPACRDCVARFRLHQRDHDANHAGRCRDR